jgi:hypothetical protein
MLVDPRTSTYLSAEEPVEEVGFVRAAAAEGFRAGAKGMLNQLAHLFDRVPFYTKKNN